MVWLRERVQVGEKGNERWRLMLKAINTPPPQAFATPALRAETAAKYRRLKAAEQ